MFQGWTTHEVDAAKTRPACTSPVPKDIVGGGPVVQINNGLPATSEAMIRWSMVTRMSRCLARPRAVGRH